MLTHIIKFLLQPGIFQTKSQSQAVFLLAKAHIPRRLYSKNVKIKLK